MVLNSKKYIGIRKIAVIIVFRIILSLTFLTWKVEGVNDLDEDEEIVEPKDKTEDADYEWIELKRKIPE